MNLRQAIDVLGQLPYYTRENLGLALGIEGENLNYWVKRLIKERLLVPVKNGMYIPRMYPKSEVYWENLANVVRGPSYISLEYALAKYGLIPEAPAAITSVTLKSGRVYMCAGVKFIYRNIKPEFFGEYRLTGVKMAYPYKAVFDYLYLRPMGKENRINWEALDGENKQQFLEVCAKSRSVKMKEIARNI